MGAITDQAEDELAVAQLKALPMEAQIWIRHHFRNSLQAMMAALEKGHRDVGMRAAEHMVEDLERIGC